MLFGAIKRIITSGQYEKNDMIKKMDIFLLMGRITEVQYQELTSLMEEYPPQV